MKKNFKSLRLKSLFVASLFAISVNSCKKDEPAPVVIPPDDIPAVAIKNGSFKTLVAALTKAELVTTLQGKGPFTVFAPNDDAFAKAKITSLDGLTKDALTPILTSHVLSGLVKAADVKSGTAKTVNAANDIYVSVNSSGVYINGKVKVIATDVVATNGVIHVIDDVIEIPAKNLVTIAANNTDFSELVQLVLAADKGVADALTNASAAGLTVFAPTNVAFNNLYKVVPKAKLLDPANKKLLTDVLLYHVVGGRVFSTDLPNITGEVATVNTAKIKFNLTSGAKVVDATGASATITAANILGTNGVIHVIDKVLLPKSLTNDITDVAIGNPAFSTLVAALAKAELVTALKGTGPFTVFAPNNDAFTKAGITSLAGLTKEALTPILTTHVVSGLIKAADVKSGKANTLNTKNDIYLSKNSSGVYINGTIKVIATDVSADNGVIHVIDNVIVPPTKSLVTIAADNKDFSELVELVLAADKGVADALTNPSTTGLTVFAPTNAAFTELYKTVPKATLLDPANKKLLTDVLLYHVIGARVFSTDLPNVSGAVATVNSAKVTFSLTDGAKVIGTKSGASNITATNILGTNGVIHVIDKVLLPE